MRELPSALVAGAVCAVAVPLTEPGLGWPIGGLAVLVAVLVAGPRRGWHPGRLLAGGGALLLVGASALPAAGVLLFLVGTAGVLGLAGVRAQPPEDGTPAAARPLRRLDWVLPVALLDLLFAVFVAVQLTVLFGGHGYVLGPGGPSYAEYARGGFWQLTAATLLTLAVVGVVAQWAARETPVDRALIRLLVGALGVLTLVVMASALRRMGLYVGAYGFTRVRLAAFTFEVVLGALFVLVLAAGVRLRAPWLPAAAVATGVVALLGLVAVNPDAYIAGTVIARYHHDGHLDA